MKHRNLLTLTLIILTLSSIFVLIKPAFAEQPATGIISAVFLDEEGAETGNSLVLPDDSIGQQVNVLLKVTGAARVWSVKTEIAWNNNVLNLIDMTRGNGVLGTSDFLTRSPTAESLFLGSDPSTWKVDSNGNGYVSGGISDTRLVGTATTLTGGPWVTLTFEVVGYSTSSSITLSNGIVANVDTTESIAPVNSATISVPSSSTLKTLTIASDHGNPSPAGIGWYNSGATGIACSVISPVVESGVTWYCTGWTGTGSVQATGTGTATSFTIESDSTLTWNWANTPPTSSVTLTINSNHGSPNPSGTTTYTSGDSVTASISSPVTEGGNTYSCIGWTGTGSVPASGAGTTVTFDIFSDSSITWNWQLDSGSSVIPLTVVSEHGTPSPSVGSHNYAIGDSVACNLPATPIFVNGVAYNTVTEGGVTYACTGWSVSGSDTTSGTSTSVTISMMEPTTLTWNWILIPASIDVYTDKGGQEWHISSAAYGPEEQVTLSAKVTSDGGVPKASQSVIFTIKYANGKTYDVPANPTGTNGIATATCRLEWPDTNPKSSFGIVTITAKATIASATTVTDTSTFMYNYLLQNTGIIITNSNGHTSATNGPYFSRYTGPAVTASVEIRNINWNTPTSFYLIATIYDNNNVPIAYASLPQTINPATAGNPSSTNAQAYTVTLNIPTYAYVGPAKLYINLCTDDSATTGVPFCPVASTNLVIEATQ